MYHLALAAGLCVVYAALVYGFAWFFAGPRPRLSAGRALRAMVPIALVVIVADMVSLSIDDWELANRVLHVFGGGVAGYLACAFAARDAGLAIGRPRFVMAALLLVTLMGVGNELVEFALQRFASLRFAAGPLDTWFDLASNMVGVAIGAALFTPLVPRRALPRS
jgi:hypothetical protein